VLFTIVTTLQKLRVNELDCKTYVSVSFREKQTTQETMDLMYYEVMKPINKVVFYLRLVKFEHLYTLKAGMHIYVYGVEACSSIVG
jgi:hypothetical protein